MTQNRQGANDHAVAAAAVHQGPWQPDRSAQPGDLRLVPLGGIWHAVTGLIATIAGLTPHVLHHVGLFAGAVLVTGAAGNMLFGALGLLLSVPLLRRLYRRFGSWTAPAVAVGVFAAMFTLSAFVVGPAINQDGQDRGRQDGPGIDAPGPGRSSEHAGHHR